VNSTADPAAGAPAADPSDRSGEVSGGTDARGVAWVLLRAGLLPALVVDGVVVLVAIRAGSDAVAGALVGTLLTVAAFGVGPVLLRYARNVEPTLLFALAVAGYLTVVSVLAVAFALLSDVAWLEGEWVGAAILAGAAAWLAGQVRATAKLRVLTFGDRVTPG
jgi:ATP synthase protein I